MAKEKKTHVMACPHCGNKAQLDIVAHHDKIHDAHDDRYGGWDQGPVWHIVNCLACSDVSLLTYYWHQPTMEDGDYDGLPYKVLYPGEDEIPTGLPDEIKREYEAALMVQSVSPNSFGVLMGRVLELMCDDHGAKGRMLGNKLHDLAEKGVIPEKLEGVATGLKDLRNVGAHAALGALTVDEVPVLRDLVESMAGFLYTAPHLAEQAEQRLSALRKAKGGG